MLLKILRTKDKCQPSDPGRAIRDANADPGSGKRVLSPAPLEYQGWRDALGISRPRKVAPLRLLAGNDYDIRFSCTMD